MKKLLAFAFAVAICLGAVSCGNENTYSTESEISNLMSESSSSLISEDSVLTNTLPSSDWYGDQSQTSMEESSEEEKPAPNKTVSTGPDDPAGFVNISDVIPDAILEIRYYSTYNFVGERIDGYEEPCALISREAAMALKAVSDELVAKGYRIKIFDAYRPQMAVDHFFRWAKDDNDNRMQEYFYPEISKSTVFKEGYVAKNSAHSRGSAVDLTLFDMKTGKEVDMGGPFDYFGELSHPNYENLTDEQKNNRKILRDAMVNNGFKPVTKEWWHFNFKNEPYPKMYFTFPVSTKIFQ